jgi:hypothetical protein
VAFLLPRLLKLRLLPLSLPPLLQLRLQLFPLLPLHQLQFQWLLRRLSLRLKLRPRLSRSI